MVVFTLIKHSRSGAGGGGGKALIPASAAPANMRSSTTIATSALRPSTETEDDDEDSDDAGSFFDMEFSAPDEDGGGEKMGEGARLSNESSSSEKSCYGDGLRSDPSLSQSPSDDLFFKGRLLPLEPASTLFATSEPRSKPASRLKSATKLRVLMLGFKKPKSTATEPNLAADASSAAAASPNQQQKQSKLFVKLNVDEVPIASLFTRDNSSRSSCSSARAPKSHADDGAPPLPAAALEEKRFSKDALQRYLSKIKPLYVRVSKRYGEKLRFPGHPNSVVADGGRSEPPAMATTSAKFQKPHGGGNLPAGLKVVCRRLGKSRSASSAVAAVRSPPQQQQQLPRRRDDSLLEQQDGIQSAIAHCKRSFNATRESEAESPLARSMSDPGEDRSLG